MSPGILVPPGRWTHPGPTQLVISGRLHFSVQRMATKLIVPFRRPLYTTVLLPLPISSYRMKFSMSGYVSQLWQCSIPSSWKVNSDGDKHKHQSRPRNTETLPPIQTPPPVWEESRCDLGCLSVLFLKRKRKRKEKTQNVFIFVLCVGRLPAFVCTSHVCLVSYEVQGGASDPL